MTDNISVKLVQRLEVWVAKSRSSRPQHEFELSMKDCRSSHGLDYACRTLMGIGSNSILSHLSLKISMEDPTFDDESVALVLQIIASNPSLKHVTMTSSDTIGVALRPDVVAQAILTATNENINIQKLSVNGSLACYGLALFSSESRFGHIKELEVTSIPGHNPITYLPKGVKMLRLSASTFDRTANSLLNILNRMEEGGNHSTNIERLHIEGEWSWGIPSFLRSSNSAVKELFFYDIDFRENSAGCSAMDGLILGLLGNSTITALSFYECTFDDRESGKLLKELKAGSTSIRSLALYDDGNPRLDVLPFWTADNLEELHHDGHPDALDQHLGPVKAMLNKDCLSSLTLPSLKIAQVGSELKRALSTGSLRCLALPWGVGDEQNHAELAANRECLVGILQDRDSQLQNLLLGIWDLEVPFIDAFLKSLVGNSSLTTLQVELRSCKSQTIASAVDVLADSIPKFRSLRTLVIRRGHFVQFQLDEEQKLEQALAKNWQLEVARFERYIHPSEGIDQEFCLPIIGLNLQKKLDGLMQRNTAAKSIQTISQETLTHEEKKALLDRMSTFWTLPDSISLTFLLLEKMPGCFF